MPCMRIVVQKKNPAGEVTYQYEGDLLRRDENSIVLEALFDRKDMPFQDVVFRTGDRFVEYYYADRWYNIFEVHSHVDDHVKGWYCNVTRPASITADTVEAIDLALDVWVGKDGSMRVLDLDEFDALDLNTEDREEALKALDELKSMVWERREPFDQIE